MPLRVPRRVAATIAVSALAGGGVLTGASAARADADGPDYRGSAVALRVQVGLGGNTLLDSVLPAGLKFPTGGSDDLIALPPEVSKIVTLRVLHEFSRLTNEGTLASGASAAGLSLLGDLVGATVLTADCTAVGPRVGGSSLVAGLSISGTKIPVDPGPDVRIELPEALRTLVQGGIYLNEQSHTSDGALRIRALHVHLVIAPEALASALRSTIEHVRAVALQVTRTVEQMTGKTLDQLLAPARTLPTGAHGALSDDGLRRHAAAPAAKPAAPAPLRRAAAPAAGAPTARNDVVAGAEAGAGAGAPAAVAAPEALAAPDAPAKPAAAMGARKDDGASISRQAAEPASAANADRDEALARVERGEKGAPAAAVPPAVAPEAPAGAEAATAPQTTPPPKATAAPQATPAPQALAAEAPAADTVREPQQVQGSGSAGASYGKPTGASVEATRAALARESARAGTHVRAKSDGAELSAVDRAAAPAASTAADGVNGVLGIDVVVSQVTCKGGDVLQQAIDTHHNELPRTGGDSHLTKDLGAAGLGLLVLGSAAVVAVRRRALRDQ